jgi:hypothetical protein
LDATLRKVLLKVAREIVPAEIPDFSYYSATRTELDSFSAGSIAFRKNGPSDSTIYLLFSPGPSREHTYTVHVGWSFVEGIAPHDYLDQRLKLGSVWPDQRFMSGFEQLGVLEKNKAVWGEEIALPDQSGVNTADTCVIEQAVERSVRSVLDRVKAILPRFERKLLASGSRSRS